MVFRHSKFNNSIIKRWDAKGIRYIADLINNATGELYSKNEIETIYGVKMTFLCYASLVKSIPKSNMVRNTSYKSKQGWRFIYFWGCTCNPNFKSATPMNASATQT